MGSEFRDNRSTPSRRISQRRDDSLFYLLFICLSDSKQIFRRRATCLGTHTCHSVDTSVTEHLADVWLLETEKIILSSVISAAGVS